MATANDFIGLSKKGAQNLAEARNLIFRLVSIDGENMLGWPDDTFKDRVCCVIASGKVTEAELR
jgi:hypothetical protein